MEIIGAQNIIKIKEIVNMSVEAEIDKILTAARLECDKIKASSDSSELVGAIENISAEKKQIAERYKSIVAKSQRDYATKYLALRNECINGVFDKVRDMLYDFVKSDSYSDYLRKCVENEPKGFVILLSKSDMRYADMFDAECVECDAIKVGGLMLYYEDDRKIVDKSFDSRLASHRGAFLDKYGKLLCGGAM
ncbi:MAG: hypothetical protein IJO29_03980 [Oscillospiraceae bacterium]|nr:hypothetical protein [Oscillospiraceae bacterium]